jgi:NhaP-type Na+/H+ or K+/H+ antiporter
MQNKTLQNQTKISNHNGTKFINQLMNIICCILIALGINDAIFKQNWLAGILNILIGIVLMPGIMNWDYKSSNKYQKLILISVAVLNLLFIAYFLLGLGKK